MRALRTARGWTQEQLAHRAARHFTYVSAMERGERNVTLLTTLNVATALGVDPGVFLTTDERAVRRAVGAAKGAAVQSLSRPRRR